MCNDFNPYGLFLYLDLELNELGREILKENLNNPFDSLF